MSKKEEILHKLNTEDRNYIKEKFKEKDLTISDLEAKLAKSDMEVFMLTKNNECFKNDIKQLKQQLAKKDAEVQSWKDGTMVVKLGKLEEQLAEKEKEIEELNKFMSDKADEIEDLKERISNKITSAYGAELMARDTQWHLEKEIQELKHSQNQTAIDELEKVKDYIRKFVGINDVKFICTTTITDQIDQQIKELKGDV